jgi:DNA-binding NarL/FixJ family response regulator
MQKIRVAIADDHTLVRKGFRAILEDDEKEEFEVIADAPNGKELMYLLERIKAPADVCLLDVSMPEMNGYETLIAVKEKYPEMRFLILTQLEHEFIVIRMLKAGASGYMLKTVEPRELKEALKKIVDQPFYGNKLVNSQLISLVTKGEEYTKIALTGPEETFLKHCCSDLIYKQIADKMRISERTAAFYRQQLFDKLGVQSRTGLALYALKLGLVPMDEM